MLDNISRGRVDLVLGSGYVPSEFEMYGVPSSERAARLTETHGDAAGRVHRRAVRVPRPHRAGDAARPIGRADPA